MAGEFEFKVDRIQLTASASDEPPPLAPPVPTIKLPEGPLQNLVLELPLSPSGAEMLSKYILDGGALTFKIRPDPTIE